MLFYVLTNYHVTPIALRISLAKITIIPPTNNLIPVDRCELSCDDIDEPMSNTPHAARKIPKNLTKVNTMSKKPFIIFVASFGTFSAKTLLVCKIKNMAAIAAIDTIDNNFFLLDFFLMS